jgi:ribosomal protein L29
MKIKEFKTEARKKELKALERDLLDKEKTYFSSRTHESTREKKNPAKVGRMRIEIAILKTIIREKIVESIK